MHYWLKLIHVGAALISIALFSLRGFWILRASPQMDRTWVRVVPHAVDSVLLLSAIGLSIVVAQYPFVAPWLTAKVMLLVAYIGLGMGALHWARSTCVRVACFGLALGVFAWIVWIAVNKPAHPLGL